MTGKTGPGDGEGVIENLANLLVYYLMWDPIDRLLITMSERKGLGPFQNLLFTFLLKGIRTIKAHKVLDKVTKKAKVVVYITKGQRGYVNMLGGGG